MTKSKANPEGWQAEHMDRLYDAAQTYLDLGWSFFPLGMNRKPLIKWTRFQFKPTTAEEVEDWFTNGVLTESGQRIMQFNLGLATGALSGVVVVDCDNDDAVAEAKRLGLTTPFSVQTTRGQHFYWAHPRDGKEFSNHAGGNPGQALDWPHCPGLDFRGDGGFVVLPPSRAIKEDGHYIYAWDTALELDELSADIDGYRWRQRYFPRDARELTPQEVERMLSTQQLPFSLAGVRPQTGKRPSIEEELEGQMLNDGDGRNHALTRFVGEKIADGIHGDELIQEVDGFMSTFFVEMLPAKEVEATIRSVTDKDKRTHPERYNAAGYLKQPASGTPITAETVQEAQPETKPAKDWKWVDCSQPVTPVLTNLWLVKGIIPENGSVVVYGPPGVGKSFVALDMAMHVAAGMDWHGRKVNQTRVAVICPESGGGGGVNRLAAWQQFYNAMPPVLHSSEVIDLLTNNNDALYLIEALKDQGFGLVIIDTLARAMPGGDENTSKDMGAVCSRAEMIGNALGATVLVVHHTGKDAEKGARGSTVLLGAIDTEAKVKKQAAGGGVLSITKQRNGEDGIRIGYRLEVVTLGQDQDGDPVTSAVAVPEAVAAPTVGVSNSLSPLALAAYDILEALVEEAEEESDARPAVVPVTEWRTTCRSHEAFKGIGSDDAFRQAFRRGRRALEDGGFVASYGDKRYGAVSIPER